jgi:hypothetical protein
LRASRETQLHPCPTQQHRRRVVDLYPSPLELGQPEPGEFIPKGHHVEVPAEETQPMQMRVKAIARPIGDLRSPYAVL